MNEVLVTLTINNRKVSKYVQPRLLLTDFIRDEIGLTGTHLGCEHGVCGACTVMVNGEAVRSCLMLTVQAEGCEIKTVESLINDDGTLNELQQAFADNHGLQCGFCTPGFLLTIVGLLKETPNPNDEEIREAIAGNLCRCTGYTGIVKSVKQVINNSVGQGG